MADAFGRSLVVLLLVAAVHCKKSPPPDAGASAGASETGTTVTSGAWKAGLSSGDAAVRADACKAILPVDFAAPPPELVNALADGVASVRRAAIKSLLGFILQHHDAKALPNLLELARAEPNDDVRAEAVRALGALAHRDVVPALVTIFPKEKSEVIKDEILAIFGREGDQRALTIVLPLLKEKNPRRAVFDAIRGIDDPKAVPALLALLDHESGGLRSYAIEVLGSMGQSSAAAGPKLVAALSDKNMGIVREAIKAVARLGLEGAVKRLLELADAPEPRTRLLAIRALADFKNPELIAAAAAVPVVLRHAEKDVDEVRIESARALGIMKVVRAVPALGAIALGASPLLVRRAAVVALGDIGDAAALSALGKALADKDPDVRTDAARAIGRLGLSAGAKQLRDAWKKNEPDIDARVEIVRALGSLGDKASVELLLEVGEKDPVPPVRAEAGGALLRLGEVRGLRILRPILTGASDWHERRAAARAVHMASNVRGVARLLSEALEGEKEPLVRETLYRKLGDSLGPNAMRYQRKALAERVPIFRLMAANGLCKNGDPAGCKELIGALREPEATVRVEAARRLGELKVKDALTALRAAESDPVVAVGNAARRAAERIASAPPPALPPNAPDPGAPPK